MAAEMDNKTLRLGKAGDWEKLREELATMEREVRKSGSVAYSAPAGKHDDLVTALSLCVFGCRRFVRANPIQRTKTVPFTSAAWT